MTPHRLRTIIIGFGGVSSRLSSDERMSRWFPHASHAAVLKSHRRYHWDAVVDPSSDARDRARSEWNVPSSFQSLAEVDDLSSYDVAVVATPPKDRLSIIRNLPGIKGLMIEKPVGESLEETRAIAEHCRRNDIAAQVNFWRRGVAEFQSLQNGGLAAHVGTPQAIFATYGNGLRNNGVHLADMIDMLFGRILSVCPLGEPRAKVSFPIAGDIDCGFAARTESGAIALVQPLDFSHYREIGLDIWGTGGRLSLTQESLAMTVFPKRDNRGLDGESEIDSTAGETRAVDVGSAFDALYENLADAVGGKCELLSPLENALGAEASVDAVICAARANGPEYWADVRR